MVFAEKEGKTAMLLTSDEELMHWKAQKEFDH